MYYYIFIDNEIKLCSCQGYITNKSEIESIINSKIIVKTAFYLQYLTFKDIKKEKHLLTYRSKKAL